jgi:hypothetical protein
MEQWQARSQYGYHAVGHWKFILRRLNCSRATGLVKPTDPEHENIGNSHASSKCKV